MDYVITAAVAFVAGAVIWAIFSTKVLGYAKQEVAKVTSKL